MKIIKIDRCLDCPHHHIIHTVRFTSAVTLGCKKEWRRIEDDSSIPDWCPLEDAIPTSAMHSDSEGQCECGESKTFRIHSGLICAYCGKPRRR